ncbi:MAG: ABC transporter ATP-binding protein [Alphaproteobacteria bacterium]|nr:ABC transporter ATP-binding protein [Alphaproteobacteria bacterium]MBT4082531.1 ABC transporter ATP-binding protein [Alphaproteobacteria bacterium]MBT4543479.1 ABC transporter ATP-binding protein [Alphaproteobacteria bacterium]MBT6387891.1 ABC transporter ATP-binding protein [Alphaproteobacteria bacterium]MBT7745627.1 ABC transporter ATP-binding protein [Alphaproteobacteria bacterium]
MASVSGETLVDLQDLHLTLDSGAGAVNILRGVDLQITRGETLGVVGPSGSGKSTMLAVTAGLERPSSGHVNVAGKDLGLLNEDQLALFRRKHVGIVFQSFHLIPTMTAHENVAVPLELAGDPDAFERARESLADVGLSDRLTHYPTQLSGGEQQRVALARAFVGEPDLILADEPTGNLDSETGAAIIDLMFGIRRDLTLMLITHDDQVATRCDRVVRMADGKLEPTALGQTPAADVSLAAS